MHRYFYPLPIDLIEENEDFFANHYGRSKTLKSKPYLARLGEKLELYLKSVSCNYKPQFGFPCWNKFTDVPKQIGMTGNERTH